jgi:Uma2 family endonuclease
MLLELSRFEVLPGQRLVLRDVTWPEFEAILAELGERRSSRIAYSQKTLEIFMPLPEHEFAKEIISDLLKALLEELDIEFCSLGSTTFKQPEAEGLESDQCFYIQNEAAIRGKKRLNMGIDPPPDLALEVDITSRTYPEIYAALGVPELWQFSQGRLQIKVLREGKYEAVAESPNFPGFALTDKMLELLEQSAIVGRNAVLKSFRAWVKSQTSPGLTLK